MPARVVSSLQNDSNYIFNRCILQNGLGSNIQFEGHVNNQNQDFNFEHGRTYDFVRTAGCEIRDVMTTYLTHNLPNIDEDAKQDLRSAFENLFVYSAYKDKLKNEGQQVWKSLNLLLFNPENGGNEGDYVAYVIFSCATTKGPENHYKVHTSITCQRFTWFQFQKEDGEVISNALQNLVIK